MKDNQAQKVIDARVGERCHYDGRGLRDERDFEVRALRRVPKIIRLQQQRLPRVRDVRQISHGVAEARWDDDDDYRRDHHEASEDDESPRDPCLPDHGIALLLRLRPDPIRHDHAHDRCEILTGGKVSQIRFGINIFKKNIFKFGDGNE